MRARFDMPVLGLSLLVLAAAMLFAGPARAQADAPAGELIVRFAAAAGAGDRAEARKRAAVELDSTLPVHGLQLVEVDPGQTAGAAERARGRGRGPLRGAELLPADMKGPR